MASTIHSNLAISLDGFVAVPNQSPENPFGEGVGDRLHRSMFEAADEHAEELPVMNASAISNTGCNMFGPKRGWQGSSRPIARRLRADQLCEVEYAAA